MKRFWEWYFDGPLGIYVVWIPTIILMGAVLLMSWGIVTIMDKDRPIHYIKNDTIYTIKR